MATFVALCLSQATFASPVISGCGGGGCVVGGNTTTDNSTTNNVDIADSFNNNGNTTGSNNITGSFNTDNSVNNSNNIGGGEGATVGGDINVRSSTHQGQLQGQFQGQEQNQSNDNVNANSATVSNTNTNNNSANNSANNSTNNSANNSANNSSSNQASGNNVSYKSTSVVKGSDLSEQVPNIVAPGLTTTLTETCMGSSSAGASGAGFGFSFGTTWRDGACVRRLDARQMGAFGDFSTAREMMCDSDLVRAAAKRVGRPCMEDGGKPYVAVVPGVQVQDTPTDESAAAVKRGGL